jgi:[acyl-carrier-protein] S-malonyltransferase
MGKTLHADFPAARAVFDRVEAALNLPLRKLMFEGPKEGLTQTAIAQPAIFTHALAAFEAYKVDLKLDRFLRLAGSGKRT